ncbi:hypothetical protein PTQ56_26470, partial [Klebsiella michiganensis]|nr:hypothetical protein [Klebsiella michiganensis]
HREFAGTIRPSHLLRSCCQRLCGWAYLEGEAKSLGYNEIRLETRKVNTHAVAFYVKHNYQRIANYGPYVGKDEAVCFSKHLSLKEI